jgi:hypothetical protein
MKTALTYGIERIFHYLLPTFARMVNISEKVQSANCLIGEYKHRVYKIIVLKSGGPVTVKYQLTILKSTVVKTFAGQIYTLIAESLRLIIHNLSPVRYRSNCSGPKTQAALLST